MFQRRVKLETGRGVRIQIGRAKQMVTHYIQLPARVHYAHVRIQLLVPRRTQYDQSANGVSVQIYRIVNQRGPTFLGLGPV